MVLTGESNLSVAITEAARRALGEGVLAALATLIAAPQNVGAKILIEETPDVLT